MKFFRTDCDAIIFDLDGTLWDASETSARAWIKVTNELNIDISVNAQLIREISGLPFRECVVRVFGDHLNSYPDLVERLDETEQEHFVLYGGTLYPKAEETLQALGKKYKLFLVSNCEEWYLNTFFGHSQLRKCFTDALCFGQTEKPKKDNIKEIIDRHNLKNPIYVGDTEWDQSAAFAAGAKFIFAEYGFGKIKMNSPKINSLNELCDIMERD